MKVFWTLFEFHQMVFDCHRLSFECCWIAVKELERHRMPSESHWLAPLAIQCRRTSFTCHWMVSECPHTSYGIQCHRIFRMACDASQWHSNDMRWQLNAVWCHSKGIRNTSMRFYASRNHLYISSCTRASCFWFVLFVTCIRFQMS